MHNTMLLLLFVLFVDGVSGADPDETLSVMEGDSVTLHTGLTEILNDDTIVWKFGPKGSFISEITRENNYTLFSVTDDVGFRGRLQVDQNTGSLTIRNTREKHSGQYHLTISRGKDTSKTFHVTVQRVVSGTDGVKSKSVSVREGETVTLNPDKIQIQGDDLMLWRFVDQGILLAKVDVETKETSLYDAEERFRDRLELDPQTGSLTITNTRTTDAGLYQLQIRGRESLQQFVLTVNQPGLSPGAVAGIVVGVLLFLAAAGVIYYRRQNSKLQKQILTVTETVPVTVSVKEGEPVTLKPNKEINNDDYILWQFGDEELLTGIAEIRTKPRQIVINDYDYAAAGRFRDRLELNKTTGSLIIRDSRTTHSGLYKLHITSSGVASEQRFFVTVNETLEEKSVKDGDSVTLNPDTEIQGDDQILWMFGDQEDLIAQLRGGTVEIYDGAAGIFRGKLELNKTGSLTITNTEAEHAGLYKLQIITSRRILFKKFRVFIPLRHVLVTVGESVHLSTGLTKIERDGEIQWMFGGENSLIADIKRGTRTTYDVPDGRFGDRLQLDTHTGDLTIKNSTDEHAGCYNLKIRSSKGDTNSTYIVTRARGKSMTKGNNDYTIKPVSESEMRSLLNKQVPDGVNEEERKSSV